MRTTVGWVNRQKQNIDQMNMMQIQITQQQYYVQSQQQTQEFMNCKKQLQFIISRFRGVHADDEKAIEKLNEAETILTVDNIHSCANTIQVIY